MHKINLLLYRKIQLPVKLKRSVLAFDGTGLGENSLKRKAQSAKLRLKTQNSKLKSFYFFLALFTFTFLSLILSGCLEKFGEEQAQSYAQQSQDYYQRAVKLYQDLIAQRKNAPALRLQLGNLYFNHADFNLAIEVLKGLDLAAAKKPLAISYYRLGNFTDALEVFNKYTSADEEYLYYHGLTCEKLNLFDQALDNYRKIPAGKFAALATDRIQKIEKRYNAGYIQDINAQISSLIAQAPGQDEYPQAGALILFCNEKISITADNTQLSQIHYVIKILNERGKEGFSESHIGYDSTYEKVELEYARTIRPDGAVVEVGSRHIRDVSRYLNFPLYSNARAFIISFPEITEGAVVEYKAKIYRSQLINKKDLVLSYPLQAAEPIIAAKFSLELAANKELYIKNINTSYNDFGANLEPVVERKGAALIYTWQFKNIPQIIPEPHMPESVEVNPAMLISTFNSWDEVYRWWWALAKDKIKADAAIKEKVEQLLKNKYTAEDKLSAIYNFCAQEIRYVAVEYGQAGYEPHQAADIFRNKYGDCKDQSILLTTMLKEAGFSAWPVLIPTVEYYNLNPDFPATLFDHCIAAVELGDNLVFLDPTAQTCSFRDLPAGDQDRAVLVCKENTYQIKTTPLYPAGNNLMRQSLAINIDEQESIEAEREIVTRGRYDQFQRAWLLYTPPELIEQALKEKIQGLSIGAQLERYTISNLDALGEPVVLSYTFRGPEYFTSAGELRILPQLASLDATLVAKDSRRYTLDLRLPHTEETIIKIVIPNDLVIKYIPRNISADTPCLSLDITYNHKANEIIFAQKTVFKKTKISPSQYADFKSFFSDLAKKIKQRIVLERKR